MSPHLFAVAQRAYWGLLAQRQDQAIVALGRSNTGKTTACQNILEYLVATAGSVDNRVTGRPCSGQPCPAAFKSQREGGREGHACILHCFGFPVEKIQAMFTVLRAFGTVSTGPNRASTRFSMVMALDFSASGHVTAAHLQVRGLTGTGWGVSGAQQPLPSDILNGGPLTVPGGEGHLQLIRSPLPLSCPDDAARKSPGGAAA